MKVNRSAALKMFLEIGWNGAHSKMNKEEWVQDKLHAVPKNIEDVEFEDPEVKELADAICKALEEDKEIEFELEGDMEEETKSEKPAKTKKGVKAETKTEKPAKTKKGDKAAKESKSEGGKRGRSRSGEFLKDWGPRETSEAGKLFRAVGKKAMSVANVAKKMEISEKAVLKHCSFWKDRGAPISVDNDSVSLKV